MYLKDASACKNIERRPLKSGPDDSTWYHRTTGVEAEMEFDEAGFTVGMVCGGMMSMASAAHHAVGDLRQQQKNLQTVQSWSLALDRANLRAISAERQNARLAHEVAQLRAELAYAQVELSMYRNA